MKRIYYFLGACMMLLASCSDEEPLAVDASSNQQGRTDDVSQVETFDIKVSYKGKMYEVPCEYVNDSLYYLNEEFSDLFLNEISKSDRIIACYDSKTGVIEYFTSNEEFLKAENVDLDLISSSVGNVQPLDEVATRANYEKGPKDYDVEAYLYDDDNYSDTHLWVRCNRINYTDPLVDSSTDVPYMGDYGLNDKVTSLKVHVKTRPTDGNDAAILVCYEDSKYNEGNTSKAVLYCKAYYGQDYGAPNLKKVPAHGRDSWNDRISSLKLIIGNSTEYPNGTV